MLFPSQEFLFVFLPALLGLYLLCPGFLRNSLLCIASLVFYALGESFYVLLLLGSCLGNFVVGLLLNATRKGIWAKPWLAMGCMLNLVLLGSYKYANFLVDNVNHWLAAVQLPEVMLAPVHLPAGISFFTFHAISYLVDIYRDRAKAETNPVNMILYIVLFPQLIAGPIIRYHAIAAQLRERVHSWDHVRDGSSRFIYGLAKKVMIANPLGLVADSIFALPEDQLTIAVAWLGLLCYTLQIYFDFSGYSDMAIGLGRIFGFIFPENFNYPYISQSIREFWRRWHMSLSNWFRDYLYIPLGGNQASALRVYGNLLLVFFLCGLWHGASWNFVLWGLFHGFFLVVERAGLGHYLDKIPASIRHVYVMVVIMLGWVLFRADNPHQALVFYQALFGILPGTKAHMANEYVNGWTAGVLLVGIITSAPVFLWFQHRMKQEIYPIAFFRGLQFVIILALLVICLVLIDEQAYNPFIYFRF